MFGKDKRRIKELEDEVAKLQKELDNRRVFIRNVITRLYKKETSGNKIRDGREVRKYRSDCSSLPKLKEWLLENGWVDNNGNQKK